uniref:DUF72 domain-containing protein n=1 Tax=Ignisphaera aggregans TaxID=334771 RepID=A0A7C4FGE8_9CREN
MRVLYVGCCGFCVARQRYYSTFSAVELQDTFYNPPEPERLRTLASEAPQGFVFAMKAWQAVSHPLDSPTWKRAKAVPDKRLADRYGFLRPTKEVFEAWERVVEGAKALNARVVVIQTPPSFGYTEENFKNAVEFFSSATTASFVIGWEPRGTWLQNIDKVAEVVSRFKNLVHVVDPFKALPAVSNDVAYFRLHGIGEGEVNYRYRYADRDLQRLLETVREVLKKSREAYIMFNNVYMAQDAQRFKELAKAVRLM